MSNQLEKSNLYPQPEPQHVTLYQSILEDVVGIPEGISPIKFLEDRRSVLCKNDWNRIGFPAQIFHLSLWNSVFAYLGLEKTILPDNFKAPFIKINISGGNNNWTEYGFLPDVFTDRARRKFIAANTFFLNEEGQGFVEEKVKYQGIDKGPYPRVLSTDFEFPILEIRQVPLTRLHQKILEELLEDFRQGMYNLIRESFSFF